MFIVMIVVIIASVLLTSASGHYKRRAEDMLRYTNVNVNEQLRKNDLKIKIFSTLAVISWLATTALVFYNVYTYMNMS